MVRRISPEENTKGENQYSSDFSSTITDRMFQVVDKDWNS